MMKQIIMFIGVLLWLAPLYAEEVYLKTADPDVFEVVVTRTIEKSDVEAKIAQLEAELKKYDFLEVADVKDKIAVDFYNEHIEMEKSQVQNRLDMQKKILSKIESAK
jgi:hypothetical protein